MHKTDPVEDWLDLERDFQSDEAARTPTLGRFVDVRNKVKYIDEGTHSVPGHRIRDSLATVKQADIWDQSASKNLLQVLSASNMEDSQRHQSEDKYAPHAGLAIGKEKPLPPPPLQADEATDTTAFSERPSLQPRPSSMQSFQRPKRKVVWKGRNCVIALPLDDERGSSDLHLMKPSDVQARLRLWDQKGYNTTGFVLDNISEDTKSAGAGGQSRSIHPDSTDVIADRSKYGFRVSVPDPAEWDSWIEHVKEERLRALGVTTSDSELPLSTQSPFSATMSRTSSQYPGLPISPPYPPSSVGSNQILQNGHMFSPHFNPSTGVSSQAPSMASPQSQFVTLPGPAHRYKPSLAYPPMEARMTSPLSYPVTHPTPPLLRDNSPPHYFSQRQSSISPANHGSMQSLGQVLSPVSPFPVDNSGRNSQPSVTLERMRQQQQELQAQLLRQQQQQITFNQSRPGQVFSTPPDTERQFRADLEVAHPTPRGHQRNYSEALQREIDEAETMLERNSDDDGQLPMGHSPLKTKDSEARKPYDPKSPWAQNAGQGDIVSVGKDLDEQSEIETNPSLRASPLIQAENLPFSYQTKAIDAYREAPIMVSGHKMKPSMSKLNVEAKEFRFDPKAAFISSNFQFGSSAFQPDISGPNLNATAPAFKPSSTMDRQPSTDNFNFSSPTFNVDAPAFNPTGSVISIPASSDVPGSDDPTSATSKIFGKIDFDHSAKASRRTSKALPIIKPDPLDSDLEERNKVEEDEEGRPAPSVARSKRARREGSDGDQEAVYAPHTEQPPAVLNTPDLEKSIFSVTAPASPALSSTNKQDLPDKWEPFAFGDEKDASIFDAARPISPSVTGIDTAGLTTPIITSAHQYKPSLSALATPFVPGPAQKTSATPEQVLGSVKSRKSMGLEASRFAATPSPQSTPAPASSNETTKSEHELGPLPTADDVSNDLVAAANSTLDDITPPVERETGDTEVASAEDEISVMSDGGFEDPSRALSHPGEPVPSYEEIDAVMRQFENDPDLGVERQETPVQSTPATAPQLHPTMNIRSDAPSPSPMRVQAPRDLRPPFNPHGYGIEGVVNKLGGDKDGEISDWNDVLSSPDGKKIGSRAQFFDAHVVDLVGGLLDNRVGPMERTLKIIQHSLAMMATKPTSGRERRSQSTDVKESDADDEDEDENLDDTSLYRTKSPAIRKDRKPDMIKTVVMEALAAHKAQSPEPLGPNLSALTEMIADMRRMTDQSTHTDRQAELKAVVEEVIGTHPRLRGHRVQRSQDGGVSEEKSKLQINGLETMLMMANERANEEANARRDAEAELTNAVRKLRYAEEQAAQHRESSEEAERSLRAYHKEKEAFESLEDTVSELSLKNAALETTLEEYRLSSDQWRDDIQEEHLKNKDLRHTLHSLKRQLEEGAESKQALRGKVDRLHHSIAIAVSNLASDQATWKEKEYGMIAKNEKMQAVLDHEIRRREKAELELDELDKEHKQNVQFKDKCARLQQDVSRLDDAAISLRVECKEAHNVAFRHERELQQAHESTEAHVSRATAVLETDLKLAHSQVNIIRADLEAQIVRLQTSLDNSEFDAADAKAKHDAFIEETLDAHSQALHQATENKDTALQSLQSTHEKKLTDLRERHTRALHNSSDDRHRLEHHLNEKLSLSNDKVQHLETKLTDLEERLEITRSAARAAVEAATAKGINLPTPASSVVASPPRSSAASIPLLKGSDIPEKISPQALRESIMVLQDQLQNREQTIEALQGELAEVDKEAPGKIKDRETEIAWLRELLGVRVDDLEDIIKTLSQPEYDRDTVKDAAIRLRANLQMKQQEQERAASGIPSTVPSIASLSNLTQSPRALPMAAAAAWGNWRKARDASFEALTDLTNLGNQTPSRSTFGSSPQSFLAGLMTPPSTNQRGSTPTPRPATGPPAMMSLNASGKKLNGEARPLRAHNTQNRSFSTRQIEKHPALDAQSSSQPVTIQAGPPTTPPIMRTRSYDPDPDVQSFDGDVDEDASLIGDKDNMDAVEPFEREGEINA